MPCRRDLLSVLAIVAHEKDAARPRVNRVTWGKLRDVKRPACSSLAGRRVSTLRPGCVSAMPQTWGVGRSDRRVPTDMLRTKLGAPSQESSGGGPASNSGRRTGPRTGDLRQTPSIRSVLVAKDQRQTPHCQRSLLGDSPVNPCTRDHAPRFLGSETLEKANSETIITARQTAMEDFRRPAAQIVRSGYEKPRTKFA